jgi:hypothetical protein
MRQICKIDKNIALYGNQSQIDAADELIKRFFPDIASQSEGNARIMLQSLIDTEPIKVSILYDGNGVYSQKKIIRDIKRVKKNGMKSMTNGLYEFLHLCCGSIAHYNKLGWIDEYPTIEDLRSFFKRNEFGERVLNHLPLWKTDVRAIVKEIEDILCIAPEV